MKRLTGLGFMVLCIFAMHLSACGSTTPQSTTKVPDSQQIFHYPTEVISDFGTLDPALVQTVEDIYAIQMVFTGLVQYADDPTFNNVVNEIASEWKTVLKVDVKVNLIDANTLNQELQATAGNDSLQMWAYDWQADYPDPQDWLSAFFGSGQDYNNNNYGDKRNENAAKEQAVQAQLAKADVEQDGARRLNLYNDAEQKLINDIAWVPLYQLSNLVVQNPKLHGYKTNALEITDPDSWNNVYLTL